jgi:uncharacterized membrane protein
VAAGDEGRQDDHHFTALTHHHPQRTGALMSKRMVESFTVTIDKPIDEVFAYISDVNNHAAFSPTPFRIDEVSDESFATGAKFASFGNSRQGENHRNDVEVTANEAPNRFALTSLDEDETYINEFKLSDAGGSTTVEKVLDMPKPGGPMGMAFPGIFKSVIAPRIQEGMDKLKTNLES